MNLKPQKWKIKDVMDFINEIEDKFDVDEWVIDNIHIWPVLRILLAFQLDDIVVRGKNVSKSQVIIRAFKKSLKIPLGLAKFLYASVYDYKNSDRLNKKVDTVFITYSSARHFLVEKQWFDVFCDPFINLLNAKNIKNLVLEYSPDFDFRIPRYHKSIFIQHKLTFLLYISVLKANRINIPAKTLKSLNSYFSFLRSKNLNSYVPNLAYLKKKISHIRHLSEYFKSIFKKVGPSLVLGSNYYGLEMAVNLACRELGIVSVDIQHGVQGNMHVAYGRWNKVPEKGYELLPNIFWNWSKSEKKTIIKWSKDKNYHRSIVGGNLLLAFFNQKDNEIIKYYDEIIKNILSKNQINILVSLQWERGLPELYKMAIKNSPDNYYWWLRLHPVMSTEEKNKMFKIINSLEIRNINIYDATRLPLYVILLYMDVHVTENSSIVLEAEHFGVPSVITHHSGTSFFQKQIESGIASFARTGEELIKLIEIQVEKYPLKNKEKKELAHKTLDDLFSYIKSKSK